MRVDPKGFYLCWVDQNNELDILDIATIRDVRNGQYAKKPRVSKVATFCPTEKMMKATNEQRKKNNPWKLAWKFSILFDLLEFLHLLVFILVLVSGKRARQSRHAWKTCLLQFALGTQQPQTDSEMDENALAKYLRTFFSFHIWPAAYRCFHVIRQIACVNIYIQHFTWMPHSATGHVGNSKK